MIKLYKKVTSYLNELKSIRRDNIVVSGKLSIDKNETAHDVKMALIESDIKLLNKSVELKDTKNKLRHGLLMQMIGTLGTLVSLVLSICGGYKLYKGVFEVLTFVLIMGISQLYVYVTSINYSRLKGKGNLKVIQILALFISVYNSYNFFVDKTLVNLILCVILDIGSVLLLNVGADFKKLSYKNKSVKVTFWDKLFNNLTYKINRKVTATYMKNNSININNCKRNLERKQLSMVKDKLQNRNSEQKNAENSEQKIQNKNAENSEQRIQNKTQNKNAETKITAQKIQNKDSELENAENSEQKFQNKIIKFRTTENSEQKITAQITEYLLQNYNKNEKIKSFEKMFNLKKSDYRKIQNILKIQNIIYTEKGYMYLKNSEQKEVANNE